MHLLFYYDFYIFASFVSTLLFIFIFLDESQLISWSEMDSEMFYPFFSVKLCEVYLFPTVH